jgi:UDP-N-acetylglucosamine acyltransferase
MVTTIHPTAVIYENVVIGNGVVIGPYCVIGAPPEHLSHKTNPGKGVFIGDNVTLTKAVVIDSGIENRTQIEDNCYIMSGVHIGHDAWIGESCVLSPKAVIGGHAVVNNECNIGINAALHQWVVIAKRVMIGMGAVITKKAAGDIGQCETWAGNPARFISMNKKYQK